MRFILFLSYAMSLAGELIRRITPKRSEYELFLWGSKVFRIQLRSFMVPKWSLCDAPVKSYTFPIHRNGRGQTGKFRSPNIYWPALESFVLPLSTPYLKTSCAARFAEERYFIEVRPVTKGDFKWALKITVKSDIF